MKPGVQATLVADDATNVPSPTSCVHFPSIQITVTIIIKIGRERLEAIVGSKTGVACASDDTSSSFRNNLKICSFSSLRRGLKLGQMDAAEKRGKEGKCVKFGQASGMREGKLKGGGRRERVGRKVHR